MSNLNVNESRSHSLYVAGEQLCATQDFAQRRQWQVHKLDSFDGVVALQHDKRVDRRLRATTGTSLTTRQRRQLGMNQVLSLQQQNVLTFQSNSHNTFTRQCVRQNNCTLVISATEKPSDEFT